MAHAPINTQIVPGVNRLSRSKVYARKNLFKKQKVVAKAAAKPTETPKVKTVNGAKNGGKRTVVAKGPRFYAADDVALPKKSRKTTRPTPLRKSITPGTVLILLAGKYHGRRVVFLKQLDSGLLLVTGPHKVNGVPLRRVNQAYVIATSTKLDISSLTIDPKVTDAYFKKAAKPVEGEKKSSPERITIQQSVDKKICEIVAKDSVLKAYLNKGFSLDRGQYPHTMKF